MSEDTENEFYSLISKLVEDEFVDGVITDANIESLTRILNRLASILEYQERLYLEAPNSPLEDDRDNFLIGKLLEYINETVTDNVCFMTVFYIQIII
jgi:hypothetical protein